MMLFSLLKDCYCRWPDASRARVAQAYQLYNESGILSDVTYPQFVQWLDLTGMQRHLKAAGIFTRLYHRDGKSGYLKDIPRTLGYMRDVATRYPQLAALLLGWNSACYLHLRWILHHEGDDPGCRAR